MQHLGQTQVSRYLLAKSLMQSILCGASRGFTSWPAQRCDCLPTCSFEGRLPGGPWRHGCFPSEVGEFWYDDDIKDLLQGPKCKDACSRIKASARIPEPRHLTSAGFHAR